jgi:hypothetical protein
VDKLSRLIQFWKGNRRELEAAPERPLIRSVLYGVLKNFGANVGHAAIRNSQGARGAE